MKFRKSMLSASIATALLFAAASQAAAPQQDQSATANQQQTTQTSQSTSSLTGKTKTQTLGTIQVVGIRASLMKSLETQRAADTIVSAVTAEDIGKFPNTDVAEALTMAPGVTVDRRFGQGGRVSVNGTDPNLNIAYLDGAPVANVDWLFGAPPDRGFDWAVLAPDIVGKIEIHKTSEASLPSGSLGATIDIHSRQPLDLKANTLAVSVGANYNDQSSKTKPNASVMYSWKNDANTFGFDIAASHFEQSIDRQGREIFGFEQLDKMPTSPGVMAGLANGSLNQSDWIPQEVNAAHFQQTRKRDSVLANIEWKPTDNLTFGLSGLYIRENFNNFNQSLYGFQSSVPQNIDKVTGSNGFVTETHVCGVGETNAVTGAACGPGGMTFDNNARAGTIKTKGVKLNGAFNGDHWGLTGQVALSTANVAQQQWFIEPTYMGGYTENSVGGFTFDDPAAALNPANWGEFAGPGTGANPLQGPLTGWLGNHAIIPFEGRDMSGRLDAHVDFDSFINSIQFGVRYEDNAHHTTEYVWGNSPGTGVNLVTLGAFPVQVLSSSTFAGYGAGMKNHLENSRSAIIDYVEGQNYDLDPANAVGGSYMNNTWSNVQKTSEAYVQADFDAGNGLRGNFGVRFARNKFDIGGYQLPSDATGPGTVAEVNPSWWVNFHPQYNRVLPSFNVVYDPGNDFVFRASAAKVIGWAPYSEQNPGLFLNTTVLTGSGGNPDLEPYSAYVYQGSFEWYFAPQSVFAVTPFYYHFISTIASGTKVMNLFNTDVTQNPTSFASQVAAGNCAASGYCNFNVTTMTNVGGASIRGMSVSYQQPFGNSGFGLVANWTFADGHLNAGGMLPYNSKNSITLSPYFEKDGFSARISYNWRSKYAASGYVAGAAPAVVQNFTEIDASIGYDITKQWNITLAAQNLLNSAYKQVQPLPGTATNVLMNQYVNGRQYMATLHFKL